jgi:hypothetical protein
MIDSSTTPPAPAGPIMAGHSRLGIASFALAILAIMVICVDIIVALAVKTNPTVLSGYNIIDVALTCSADVLTLVGLGLGIAAVVQKKDLKIFGTLGLILNGLFLLGICGLYAFNIFTLISGAS